MAAKKKTGKASRKKPGVVLTCSSCRSPHASTLLIGGNPRYVCQRCGHVSKERSAHDFSSAKELHRQRKSHAARSHRFQQQHRHSSLSLFVERFHLRAWFKIISTTLLGFGVVLLPTSESWTGALFLFTGLLGLYAGLKWL